MHIKEKLEMLDITIIPLEKENYPLTSTYRILLLFVFLHGHFSSPAQSRNYGMIPQILAGHRMPDIHICHSTAILE
jgi:hypothetical protein